MLHACEHSDNAGEPAGSDAPCDVSDDDRNWVFDDPIVGGPRHPAEGLGDVADFEFQGDSQEWMFDNPIIER